MTASNDPNKSDDGSFDSLTPRGFTGHEMLDDLGLVHMNGRIYDPLLGRFLSADLVVQIPGNLQSYNRYSYVFNNPLSYTDPSGFLTETDAQKKEREEREKEAELARRKASDKSRADCISEYGLSYYLSNWAAVEDRASAAGSAAAASAENAQTAETPSPDRNPGVTPSDSGERITQSSSAAIIASASKTFSENIFAPTESTGVGAPGTMEGLIPVWGSARSAINDFQNRKWGWGTFNTGMAVSDIFLVKSAATILGKGAWKAGSASWTATRKWLGKRGYAEFGQHVHHGIISQEVFRGSWWEKLGNQPWNLKPLEPRGGYSMDMWHKMVEGKLPGLYGPERWWHGTPDWFRFTQISGTGHLVNAFANDGGGSP